MSSAEHHQTRVWRPKSSLDESTPNSSMFEVTPNKLRGELRSFLRDARDDVGTWLRDSFESDRFLEHATHVGIEAAATRYALRKSAEWEAGKPLKLLLAGYNGTRNTGADARVEEMIRQFRHLLSDDHLELSVFTFDPDKTRGYFRAARQIKLPKLYPKALLDAVDSHHGVIACEGSMFKSKFSNALTLMMSGALGMASAQRKLSIAYGGEAGEMDPSVEDFVAKHCQDALVVTRNTQSQGLLHSLGLKTELGTDTAWTYRDRASDIGRNLLAKAGWDGVKPILALCPINPFWWPVKPNAGRALVHRFSGMFDESHYGSIYFHRDDADVAKKQAVYLQAWAKAVKAFQRNNDCFVVLIGSEALDREACEGLRDEIGEDLPLFVSDHHDMYELVSVMRSATWMVSSRYHAIVLSMPRGVLSVGVTMDERIANLMQERNQAALALRVDEAELDSKILNALEYVKNHPQEVREGIDICLLNNLERMGRMGMILVDQVREQLPGFPVDAHLGKQGDPFDHLPAVDDDLSELMDRRVR